MQEKEYEEQYALGRVLTEMGNYYYFHWFKGDSFLAVSDQHIETGNYPPYYYYGRIKRIFPRGNYVIEQNEEFEGFSEPIHCWNGRLIEFDEEEQEPDPKEFIFYDDWDEGDENVREY